MIDFPNNPVLNQTFSSPNGVFAWDGTKWVPQPVSQPDAPIDGKMYGRVNWSWGRAVNNAGDTLTGNLVFSPPSGNSSYLGLNKPASGMGNYLIGNTNGLGRWWITFGDTVAESGSNAGSNFQIANYNDSGSAIGTPLFINRASGISTFPGMFVGANPAPTSVADSIGQHLVFNPFSGSALNFNAYSNGSTNKYVSTDYAGLLTGNSDGTWRFQMAPSGAAGSSVAFSDYIILNQPQGTVTLTSPGGATIMRPGQNCILNFNKSSATMANIIYGNNGTANRWLIIPGTGENETGGNAGSNFCLWRCNDSGGLVDQPLTINRANAQFVISGAPYCPGGGSWGNSSDSRIKNVVGAYSSGLDQVSQLEPKLYTYKGNDTTGAPTAEDNVVPYHASMHYAAASEGKQFIGLIAQDVEGIMPELVVTRAGYIDGQPVDDVRDLNQGPLVFALVNAVKELAARLEAVEAKLQT
jgi:hypothetical protein